MADTWGDLLQSIVTGLNRDDLTDEIHATAREIVRNLQRTFFYVTPVTTTFPTVPGQVLYLIPESIVSVTHLRLDYANTWLWLNEVEYKRLLFADVNIPSTRSPPWMWAPYDSYVRLFPAPDRVYTVEITGDGKVPIPATDDTSNFWTGPAAALVKYETMAQLFLTRIRSDENYRRCKMAAEEHRIGLLRETTAKTCEGVMSGHW